MDRSVAAQITSGLRSAFSQVIGGMRAVFWLNLFNTVILLLILWRAW